MSSGAVTSTTDPGTSGDPTLGTGSSTGAAGGGTKIFVEYTFDDLTDPVVDHALNPADLTVTSDAGEPVAVGTSPHLGAGWTAAGVNAKLQALVVGTKLGSELTETEKLTVELVVDIDDGPTGAGTYGSNILYLGSDANPTFALSAAGPDGIRLRINGTEWWWDLDPGRPDISVIHVAFDFELAQAVHLYLNGAEVQPRSVPPSVGRFDIVAGDSLPLGNRPAGGDPFEGRIYYAALHRDYLEAEKVANNAADLLMDDDTP